ncbi:MAG: ISNCY family transposase [Spirochaetaceae bacterium]|nr:ISNCY family transposase [Spirochaetaceae bacterium]
MMSKRELGKLAIIQGAVDGVYTVKEAALRLHLGERRIKQLKKEFWLHGEGAVIHGNAGKHPANYTGETLRGAIASLKQSAAYEQANFTRFRELLEEREAIRVSYATLCRILKAAGIASKRKRRGGGKRFSRRKRRSRFGELLQAGAASYDWFGTGERESLHGFIDDATGQITALYMAQNECLMGYLELLRQTLAVYGLPIDLYADKAGIFFANTRKPDHWTAEELLAGRPLAKTQFGTVVDKLGTGLISAHTPQAKGRIERLRGTLRDRLPVWFTLNGIATREQANAALTAFIREYNAKFAVLPESAENAFVSLDAAGNLDTLPAVRHERTAGNCSCFPFHNFAFQMVSERPIAKKKTVFLFSERTGFKAYYEKR